MASREILGIQYLRGIAACAVALDHAAGMAEFEKYFGEELLGGFLTKGAIGVDIFFMISGFIIAIVALSPSNMAPKVAVGEFARRRFIRIIPIMWIAILSYAALRYLGRGDFDPYPYLRALTLWPEGDVDPNPIWTLRQEAVFYLVFALTFLGPKALRFLMPVWILSPLAYAALSLPTAPVGWSGVLWTVCHPVNIEFGVGLLTGLIWLKWLRGWTFPMKGLFAFSIVYFAVVMGLAFWLDLKAVRVVDTMIAAAAFTPLLLVSIHAVDRMNRLGLLLGNASYSIYLFHSHFISALLGVWAAILPSTPVALVVICVTVLSVLAGIAIYWLLEKPLVARLQNVGRTETRNLKVAI